MAYIIARPKGVWEVRESRSTAAGPRSRTLATFRTLTPEVLKRASERASKPLDPQALRKTALRAGADVASADADRAAAELLAELSTGREPRPVLRLALLDALGRGRPTTSDSARAAARWTAATPRQRGETLRDLLLLADRLPSARRQTRERFPRLHSKPA